MSIGDPWTGYAEERALYARQRAAAVTAGDSAKVAQIDADIATFESSVIPDAAAPDDAAADLVAVRRADGLLYEVPVEAVGNGLSGDVSDYDATPDPDATSGTVAALLARYDDIRGARGLFASPASLGHRIGDFHYRVDHDGLGKLLFDLDAYMPAGGRDPLGVGVNAAGTALKIYYVDCKNGSDASAGTSWATALKSIATAMAKTDVDAVLCRGGQHYRIEDSGACHMSTYSQARDVSLIAVGPRATMSSVRYVTWSAHATYGAPVYTSSGIGGTPVKVLDSRSKDAFGDYTELTLVASALLVSTTPGSWYYDSGTGFVHVRLADDALPVDDIWPLRVVALRVQGAGARKVYIRNFDFIGGSGGAFTVRDSSIDTYVTVEDCKFSHQYNSDGFQIKDCGIAIAINCVASGNYNDGFNYHELNSLSPHFVEIGCSAFGNGNGGSTENGSTSHEDVIGLRFNCSYGFNSGPGVADVNDAKTFNVNLASSNNTAGSPGLGDGFQAGDNTEAWLHGFSAHSNNGESVTVEATATLHWLSLSLDTAPLFDGTADNDFT